MDALVDRTLGRLLEEVAARTPSPGGGTSCAVGCALAAGLVEMAAAFTLSHPEQAESHARMAELGVRAGELRAVALELAERDLHAYEPVLEALREPADAPGRDERLEAALSAAADSPLALARAAAEVAELAAEAARDATHHLRGDAAAGAALAEAACAAAAYLADLNLTRLPHDARREEASQLRASAQKARLAALSDARDV
jgi:methenyltetrahydrofolate cyclohydrolase